MPRDRKPTEAENAGRLARKVAGQIQQRGWTRFKLQDQETGNVCLLGAAYFAVGASNVNSQTVPQMGQVDSFAKHFARWLGSAQDNWHRNVISSWNDNTSLCNPLLSVRVASPETQQDLLDVLAKFCAETDPRGESDASRNPAAL